MGAAEARRPAEVQHRERREPEQEQQVLVGAILPAGRPDQLVMGEQTLQPRPGLDRDAVRHAVDQLELAGSVLRRPLEAEQADDAVDVDGEDWLGGVRLRHAPKPRYMDREHGPWRRR